VAMDRARRVVLRPITPRGFHQFSARAGGVSCLPLTIGSYVLLAAERLVLLRPAKPVRRIALLPGVVDHACGGGVSPPPSSDCDSSQASSLDWMIGDQASTNELCCGNRWASSSLTMARRISSSPDSSATLPSISPASFMSSTYRLTVFRLSDGSLALALAHP